MERKHSVPRTDWQVTVESQGLIFHTAEDGRPYWDESVYYEFAAREIAEIETATTQLNDMCLEAVEHIVKNRRFAEFAIPEQSWQWITRSWDVDEQTIYGRFDLAYDGTHPPKMLEYNADTPTALLEAAVVQWFWYKDVFGENAKYDQFNSIHERLIEAWQAAAPKMTGMPPTLHFLSMDTPEEDLMTLAYLRDTATQAGIQTKQLLIEQVGWDAAQMEFVYEESQPVRNAFKLYPWEWMLKEEFAQYLSVASTRWLEAPWKILLSSKAILPVLHELFPDSPYLLKASRQPLPGDHVRKPMYGREGANVLIVRNGSAEIESPGPYGEFEPIYQELVNMPTFETRTVVIGSWMVNGYPCGIGIREDDTPITGNLARFVPHILLA